MQGHTHTHARVLSYSLSLSLFCLLQIFFVDNRWADIESLVHNKYTLLSLALSFTDISSFLSISMSLPPLCAVIPFVLKWLISYSFQSSIKQKYQTFAKFSLSELKIRFVLCDCIWNIFGVWTKQGIWKYQNVILLLIFSQPLLVIWPANFHLHCVFVIRGAEPVARVIVCFPSLMCVLCWGTQGWFSCNNSSGCQFEKVSGNDAPLSTKNEWTQCGSSAHTCTQA